MSRHFAGEWGGGAVLSPGFASALAPHEASVFTGPGLTVAYTGRAQAGRSLCLLDGRLDNAPALRRELAVPPPRQGEAPAEALLLAAHRRWGEELLPRLRGDFALLLWDGERRRGLLARDQLGVRPLFVHQGAGGLRFAGEVRELLALLPRRPAPDPLGVAHWLTLGNRPDDGTLYEGVRRLGPGEVLLLERGGGARRRRYWRPRYREPLAAPAPELAELVREELAAATRRRLDPEAETAVLLSGGLDSSSVAALGGERLLACSGVFPEHPQADESALLATLRRDLGLGGLVAEVRPGGLVAAAVEHVGAWQMPLLGWGDFWTLPLLRAARESGAGTVLGGDGGDEVFGARGYALADGLRAGRVDRVLAMARRLPGREHAGRRDEARMVARLALGGALPARGPSRLRVPAARRRLPGWLDRGVVSLAAAGADPEAWKRLDGPRWWANAADGVVNGIEAAGVHEHQRRRARLAGMEARHPMLDLDLVELALSLPPAAMLDPRHSRPLLRRAVAGRLPDAVRLRPGKALFESLIVSCLRGPDRAAVRHLLGSAEAEVGAYLDGAAMRAEMFESDFAERAPFAWMWQLWRLLNLELWLRLQSSGNGIGEGFAGPSAARVAISGEPRLLPFSTLTTGPRAVGFDGSPK